LVDRPSITGDAVQHYLRLCPERTAVAFCISVAHAEHVAAQFAAAGIKSESIDGKLSPEERAARIERLRTGQTRVLTSCELISEGFDLPAIGAAILLRPTASLGLHLQQVGRSLRVAPGKTDAVIIDHVGNTLRHGTAEEPRDWSLDGHAAKKRAKEATLNIAQCPECYAIYTGDECPQCGAQKEARVREIEQRDGQLKELSQEDIARARRARDIEINSARSLEDLQKIGAARGYSPKWAFIQYSLRRGRWTKRVNPDDALKTIKTPELNLV
jgi:superfamily II DNA or RNA helicase